MGEKQNQTYFDDNETGLDPMDSKAWTNNLTLTPQERKLLDQIKQERQQKAKEEQAKKDK